jgi:hypothetical protein
VSGCLHDCGYVSRGGIKYVGRVLSVVSDLTFLRCVCSRHAYACVRGYDLAGSQPGRAVGSCTSQLTSGQTITYLASSQGIVTTTLEITSATTINAVDVRGWNVATSTSASNSTSSKDSSPGLSPGLSPGAKAGIGVGAALGGIGLLALIGALFLLRRRQKVMQYDPMLRAPQSRNVIVHEMSGQRPAVEMLQDPAELSSEALKR